MPNTDGILKYFTDHVKCNRVIFREVKMKSRENSDFSSLEVVTSFGDGVTPLTK